MKAIAKNGRLYIILILGICYGVGIIGLWGNEQSTQFAYALLQKSFTALPLLVTCIVKYVSKDHASWNVSLRVWKQPKLWLFCAVVPSVLIILGASLYFMIFPETYSGVFSYGLFLSMAQDQELHISSLPLFWFILLVIGAVALPIQVLELGEEIGWRGYLLPKQIARYGVHKAVLYNGFLWGLAHLPLVYFGFNYSLHNPFAPFSNMALMLIVTMVMGVICSYVTIISGNCMYAAIIHGCANIVGEVPLYVSTSMESGLLGPNPTGLLAMSFLFLCAVFLYMRLKQVKNQLRL